MVPYEGLGVCMVLGGALRGVGYVVDLFMK